MNEQRTEPGEADQGCLYKQFGIFDGTKISLDGMREYFSEGFRVYFIEPELLKKRDRRLFDFIEELAK